MKLYNHYSSVSELKQRWEPKVQFNGPFMAGYKTEDLLNKGFLNVVIFHDDGSTNDENILKNIQNSSTFIRWVP